MQTSDEVPPLIVSAVSTNLSALRAHWTRAGEDAERPLGVRGGAGKPRVELGGALLRTATNVSTPHKMAAALAVDGDALLVSSTWGVARVARDLGTVDGDVWPLPLLNAVHWLSPTERGWLVVSSGIDLIFEVGPSGTPTWEWWAIDHGFGVDPLGRRRHIDRDMDHRGTDYGTIANTTHVNSAYRLADGTTLASLFHQGQVLRIDEDGRSRVVLDGLDHPHAIRPLPDGRFSVADTGQGQVRLFTADGSSSTVAGMTSPTDWLQDAHWDAEQGGWILVDGRNSTTTWVPSPNPDEADWSRRRVCRHDSQWRIYAAIPDPWGSR